MCLLCEREGVAFVGYDSPKVWDKQVQFWLCTEHTRSYLYDNDLTTWQIDNKLRGTQ